jgi:hypothetical protein
VCALISNNVLVQLRCGRQGEQGFRGLVAKDGNFPLFSCRPENESIDSAVGHRKGT